MKKVVLLAGLLACGGVRAENVNSIDKGLERCVNNLNAPGGSSANSCYEVALGKYKKIINQKDYLDENLTLQYQAVMNACEQPYKNNGDTSSLADGWVYVCKIDVAKHFIKTKE